MLGFHWCTCISVHIQEAEAILEDVSPSPGQLLGYGTVSVKLLEWHLHDFPTVICQFGWISLC